MKNWRRVCILAVMASGVFGVQAFAAEKMAVPVVTELHFVADVSSALWEDIGYQIEGEYYFKLRDLGWRIGFDVEWDKENKITNLVLNEDAEDMSVAVDDADATATAVRQTVRISNGRIAHMSGYNIDGYTYYAIRDIAKLFDYSCQRNVETESIMLLEGGAVAQRAGKARLPANIDEIINEIANIKSKRQNDNGDRTIVEKLEARNYHLVEQNDLIYVGYSKSYDDIERYIQENLNEDFEISDYIVTESGDDEISLNAGNEYSDNGFPDEGRLCFRYNVAGARSDFGYDVSIYGGVVKLIQQVGTWNPNVLAKEFVPRYTEEEVIQIVLKEAGVTEGTHVESAYVRTHFHMRTEIFEYSVRVSFLDGAMGLRNIAYSLKDGEY